MDILESKRKAEEIEKNLQLSKSKVHHKTYNGLHTKSQNLGFNHDTLQAIHSGNLVSRNNHSLKKFASNQVTKNDILGFVKGKQRALNIEKDSMQEPSFYL
jgi:hypothetical protein